MNLFVDYIVIAATAQKEPHVSTTRGAHGETVLMKYEKVVPFGAQKPFALEAVTPIQKCHEFNMGDKKPRLIVGAVTYSEEEEEITVLAEKRIFPMEPQDVKVFYAEMEQLHGALSAEHVERVAKKRPADDLVLDTPLKMRAKPIPWCPSIFAGTNVVTGRSPWTKVSRAFRPRGRKFGSLPYRKSADTQHHRRIAVDESVQGVSTVWQRVRFFVVERIVYKRVWTLACYAEVL